MADGTVFQFEAAFGINCAKMCTVISAFSFCFFSIFKLYISPKIVHLFSVCLNIGKKFDWNRIRIAFMSNSYTNSYATEQIPAIRNVTLIHL